MANVARMRKSAITAVCVRRSSVFGFLFAKPLPFMDYALSSVPAKIKQGIGLYTS